MSNAVPTANVPLPLPSRVAAREASTAVQVPATATAKAHGRAPAAPTAPERPGPFAPARMPSHAPAQATGTHWPTIAVILVTYRAADFIADCLESLIATNYPRLRVIVVDNASPDETVEAVERFAARTGTKRDAIAATVVRRAAGNGASGNGPVGSGAVGDGASGNGAVGDGASGDGAVGNGAAGDNASGNGAVGSGASGSSAVGDGASGNAASGSRAMGSGDPGNGASGNGPAGSGASGNGTFRNSDLGNSTEGDGASGSGAVGDGVAGSGAVGSGVSGNGAAADGTLGGGAACDDAKRDGLSGTTVELHRAGGNLGFAAGVNVGLRAALGDRECDLFWVLNPDATVTPATPFALADEASRMGRFAVIGTRVLYAERPDVVQTDGGRLHALTCTGVGVNIGARAVETPLPDPASLAYIAGVSMLVSREFVETAGLMPERWFLYYEEIDWQLARGDLPIGIAPQALVLHSAGASIGSGGVHKRASPLSVYFMARNLLPFVRRHAPAKLPFAYLMAYYKLVRQWGLDRANLAAMLRGLHRLGPPADVRQRLARDVWDRALSPPSAPSRPGDAAGRLRGRTNGDAD